MALFQLSRDSTAPCLSKSMEIDVGKTMIGSSGEESNRYNYIVTLLVAFACTVFFFRLIIPRGLRLLLGGRLSIKRVGLLGVQGLEWRSKVLVKSRPAAFDHLMNPTAEGIAKAEADGSADAMVLQIKRIYPTVHFKSSLISSEEATQSAKDGSPSYKTWVTIRIEGVGLTIPQRVRVNDESKSEIAQQERSALAKEKEAGASEQDAANARLDYLMQSRPTSPMLGDSASRFKSTSPVPAFASAVAQSAPTASRTNQSQLPKRKSSKKTLTNVIIYVGKVVLQMFRLIVLHSLRTILYLFIFALPFLTSIIDIQVTHLEVYSLEAGAVVRVEKAGISFDATLVKSHGQASKTIRASKVTKITTWWKDLLFSKRNWTANKVKDATFSIGDGLLAGRVSLRLCTSGLQVIEATQAMQSTPFSTKSTPSASVLVDQRSEGPSTRPFSSSSTPPIHQSNGIDVMSSDAMASEWAGWAPEGLDSHFPPLTSWTRGSKRLVGKSIHSSARVLSMPGTNSLLLCLDLSGSSYLSLKESIHIDVNLSKATIGVDALIKVLRSFEARKIVQSESASMGEVQLPKHIKQQKSQAQARILEKLASASISCPGIMLIMSSTTSHSALPREEEVPVHEQSLLPSSVQVLSEVKGISLSIQTSNPSDKLHQEWLGTCGVKSDKDFADRFQRDQSHQSKDHFEHRRAFHIKGKLDSIKVRVGIDEEVKQLQSELLNLEVIHLSIRTTWTPYGMLSANKKSAASAPRYFQGDPNEQAIVLQVSLDRLKGDLGSRHLTALLAFAQSQRKEGKARGRESGLQREGSKRRDGYFDNLPRIHIGVKLSNLSYQLSISESAPSTPKKLSQKAQLSLVMMIPDIMFVFHANYIGQSNERNDHQMKTTWRSLQKEQLERSVKESGKEDDTMEGKGESQEKLKTWREENDKRDEIKTEEETKKMLHKRAEVYKEEAFNVRYVFDSSCIVSSVKVFWASTQRNTFDAMRATTAEAQMLNKQAKIDVLVLKCFEASTNGHLPGIQNLVSDTVKLETGSPIQDVRVNLEHLDIFMWHHDAVDATTKLVGILTQTSQPPVSVSHQSEEGKTESNEDEATWPRIDLIEYLHAGINAYICIDSIFAHVGGVDERCDHATSRGLGLVGKSVVVELNCSDRVSLQQSDALQSGLAARSALNLIKDLTVSCGALATQHGKAAMAKISLFEVGLFPILDGEQASSQHLGRTSGQKSQRGEVHATPSTIASTIWKSQRRHLLKRTEKHAKHRQQDRSNFIFWLPFSSTKVSLVPRNATEDALGEKVKELSVTTEGIRLLSFKIELVHIYCILMTLASVKRIFFKKGVKSKEDVKDEANSNKEGEGGAKSKVKNELKGDIDSLKRAKKPSRFNQLSYSALIKVDELHISIVLPDKVGIFCHIQRTENKKSSASQAQIGIESVMAAVQSPKSKTNGGLWEELVRLHGVQVNIKPGKDDMPVTVLFNAKGVLFKIPFDYQVHPLIDGTILLLKATRQLLHQLIKGGKDFIIYPVPEEPKHLPMIKVKILVLGFAADDDPFETRLNIIWRAGGNENQARCERDAAFKAKIRHMTSAGNVPVNACAFIPVIPIEIDGNDTDKTGTAKGKTERRNESKVSIEEAREALDAFNGSSWIKRCANVKAEQERKEDTSSRNRYDRLDNDTCMTLPINLAPPTQSVPLFRSTWNDFEMEVGPMHIPESQLRHFLYEQGKGMPMDIEYSLMVPLHLRLSCSEWKMDLRDYPLPLLHVPPVNVESQDKSLAALVLESDLCIAEQMSDFTAVRHVPVMIVPASVDTIEYSMSIPRMGMPTKIFGSPVIRINSSHSTRFVWGQSFQPAMGDMARVIEGITSPPRDPSPRIGFWDKLSLILHGRLHLLFPNDGELHVYMKGSRDPYHILEHGAGWVNCWKGDVELKIGFENEQKEVFQILSNEYLLAIPDLKDYVDLATKGEGLRSERGQYGLNRRHTRQNSNHTTSSMEPNHKDYNKWRPDFKKVCLKLANGVRCGAGLLLERTCTDDTCLLMTKCKGIPFNRKCRFWTRKRHWEVYQRSRDYANTLAPGEFGDSYDGWRSHHLHLSLSVNSIENVSIKTENDAHNEQSNNLYLSPLAWDHFWAWMRLFNSALSLPIRKGKLFPGSESQSPKFGRHLGTIKYRFDISPVFITHVYIQDAKSDWARGFTTLLGVKGRMGVFHLDLHQRQQEMIKYRPELGECGRVFHKAFYEAEVELGDIDLRTLAAKFINADRQLFAHQVDDDEDHSRTDFIYGTDHDCKTPEDDDYWHDLNDFVELDSTHAMDDKAMPTIRLTQVFTCPSFNYYRLTVSEQERKARARQAAGDKLKKNNNAMGDRSEHDEDVSVPLLEISKFGREDTHSCLVGKAPAVQEIQKKLAYDRIKFLREELEQLKDDQESSYSSPPPLHNDHLHHDTQNTASKAQDLQRRITSIEEFIKMADRLSTSSAFRTGQGGDTLLKEEIGEAAYEYIKRGTGSISNFLSEWQEFDNRYFIHNPSIFYSNATRDMLLKYYISSTNRRAIVHSLSTKALRNIRDLHSNSHNTSESKADDKSIKAAFENVPELLHSLLHDTMEYIESDKKDDGTPAKKDSFVEKDVDPSFGISDNYMVHKSNICILLKPQIVLCSLIDDKSTVILTATRMRVKNYSVKDPKAEEGSVNERVMYRNYASIDGLQAYSPSKHYSHQINPKERNKFLHLPLETLIDLKFETRDFDCIAPRTYSQMQYDKFNQLRLHDSNRPLVDQKASKDLAVDHLCHQMDFIRLQCPFLNVLANSDHFAAVYNIVTDLLLYRDPTHRKHAKKLEVTMLKYDFSNIDSLISLVQALQIRVRLAKELHVQYHLQFQHLNEQGRSDLLTLKGEIKDTVEELVLTMEAIKISDDNSSVNKEKRSALRVEALANDVSWNMMGHEEAELLAKLTIKGAKFTWLTKADNSAALKLSVMDLIAVNVAPDAVFSEIISKYNKGSDHPMQEEGMLLNAVWSVLAPVGGIAVIDYLEIALHPLQIQLEKKIGSRLEDYLFGSKREREKKDREQRQAEEALQEDINEKTTSKGSTLKRLTKVIKGRDADRELKEQQDISSLHSAQPIAHHKSSRIFTKKARFSQVHSTHQSNTPLILEDAQNNKDSEFNEAGQHAIAAKQALDMRNRACRNTTFIHAKVFETIFFLSYKGEKQKSITDLYDLVFKAPRLEYWNRTWASTDLASHLKKDILKAAWNQKATLLRGAIHQRPTSQTVVANIRAIRGIQFQRLVSTSTLHSPPISTSKRVISQIKELEEEETRKDGFDGHLGEEKGDSHEAIDSSVSALSQLSFE